MTRKPITRLSLASRSRGRLSARGVSSSSNEIAGLQAVSNLVIYRHVFENADREVGGVLIGRTPADSGLPLLTGAIPAISADEQRATLTFTQEAWAHVHRILESHFPADEQIVGWYHSHPGFGIFLSGHDLFIHENFFSAPSQIAMVVDPLSRTEGVFAWRGGELIALFERPTPREWVPDEHAFLSANNRAAHSLGTQSGGYPFLALAIVAIIGVMIGFGIWSLAEGSTSTPPRRTRSAAPTNTHVVKTAPPP